VVAWQGGGNFPPPTGAAWKRPPLVPWERSIEDAIAISKAEKRPLLVAVNHDGESASEVCAGEKYRDPAFAKLAAGFVPVIVSVDRHNARDYDERGRRIPCPRFGRVTCAEHIAAEPIAFEKWFKGNAVAPRHIGIDAEGDQRFDLFLLYDLGEVDRALQKHGVAPKPKPAPAIEARVASRKADDRMAVEEAFVAADSGGKVALLDAAAHSKAEPFDLLLLGMRDGDPQVKSAARKALASTATPAAVGLVAEALRATSDAVERDALTKTLTKIAAGDARARLALLVSKSLATRSAKIDVDAWTKALAEKKGKTDLDDADALEKAIDLLTAKAKADAKNGGVRLDLARALLAFAENRIRVRKNPSFLLEDAKTFAEQAGKLGAPQGGVDGARAAAMDLLGDVDAAQKLAPNALQAALADAASPWAARVLQLVGQAGAASVRQAAADQREWAPALFADAHAAYRVLAMHPYGESGDALRHVDLLLTAGAVDAADEALDAAVRRFPDASPLHERYRGRVLASRGADALETAYEQLRKAAPSAAMDWFSGYAAIVEAEFQFKSGEAAKAKASYDRGLERLEASSSANDAYAETVDHFAALALAGRARVELENGDLEKAVADLSASIARRPASVESEDGLARTPARTLAALRTALREAKRDDLSAKLEAAVKDAAPELAPPDPPPGGNGGGR
ncbi:MAG TPA: hypothetical protein VKE69_13085, partial [Planctomycetota bacterium]|nr:hypothetical protein [Planctomycetota bacterium]